MADALKRSEVSLYDSDFYAWTQDQAAKLRARAAFDNRGDIDWHNAAEEIEGMGGRDKREIRSRLLVLVHHLLKWQLQPEQRKVGWRLTIREQRRQLHAIIEQSPSLASFPEVILHEVYASALEDASDETGIAVRSFPPHCPFTIEEILDPGFDPEAA